MLDSFRKLLYTGYKLERKPTGEEKMTAYQRNKIEELKNQGWSDASEHTKGYVYRMESSSGMRAYVYPNWVQFIA